MTRFSTALVLLFAACFLLAVSVSATSLSKEHKVPANVLKMKVEELEALVAKQEIDKFVDEDVSDKEIEELQKLEKDEPEPEKDEDNSKSLNPKFLELAVSATRTNTCPSLYRIYLTARALIGALNLSYRDQAAMVFYYDNTGALLGSSPLYTPSGDLHSEQQLENNGYLDPAHRVPPGTVDVVMYTTFSPCHSRANPHRGCMPSVIAPAAHALAAANIHFTVLFSGRYTARANYKWRDTFKSWRGNVELRRVRRRGMFEMWQINRTLVKNKNSKYIVRYFGGKPPRGGKGYKGKKGGSGLGKGVRKFQFSA